MDDIAFWGVRVPPGKTVEQAIANDPDGFQVVHVTSCALGEWPDSGINVSIRACRRFSGSALKGDWLSLVGQPQGTNIHPLILCFEGLFVLTQWCHDLFPHYLHT